MNSLSEVFIARTITVKVTQARAFDVFVHQMDTWWDMTNKILGEPPAQAAIVEPHVGGRWFERDKNGVECDWGRVLVYDPNARIVLDWQISAAFEYDPALHTDVEVRFVAESPQTTRVEILHRGLENYGNDAQKMRTIFDSENGWPAILRSYAEALEAR